MPIISPPEWTEFLSQYPDAHILQTAAWGQLKGEFDWQATHVVAGDSGAQVLFRKLPLGLSLAYIPKGPVGEDWAPLWPEVDAVCKEKRAVFLKVEADLWEGDVDSDQGGQPPLGFQLSPHEIQPSRTLVVDLQGTKDQILARMKQKARYNIRLARRKGVVVRETCDIETFYQLMQVTGERDAFGVHSQEYYQRALDLFEPRGNCVLLCAEFEEQPLAGLIVFVLVSCDSPQEKVNIERDFLTEKSTRAVDRIEPTPIDTLIIPNTTNVIITYKYWEDLSKPGYYYKWLHPKGDSIYPLGNWAVHYLRNYKDSLINSRI